MDKKMVKIIGIVVGIFVFLIIILFVISSCSKKKLDYNKIQDSMIASAKQYYSQHQDDLPREDGDTKNINLKKLISEGYMEDPVKTYKDDTLNCDGSITVSNNNGYYLYSPSLTCGKNYKSQLLSDKIIEDSLVDTGIGLYEVGDQYIYKGEVDNNFVRFANHDKLFRIIRINSDGTIRLFEHQQAGEDSKVEWDDRYNPEKSQNTGINDYVVPGGISSRVKDAIKDYYISATWPDDMKAYIVTQELCMNKRSEADITKDGSTECAKKLANQQLGLINVYEFLSASLDNNCNSTAAIACQNYNWLAKYSKRIWTMNGDANDSTKVWFMFSTINKANASAPRYTNVVFNTSDKVTYIQGTGTIDNPYVIR